MHYLAPFPIMIGGLGAICGLLWLVAAGSEDDGGPDSSMFSIFGMGYIMMRVMREFTRDPMSVLPAFGILAGSGVLIWLGWLMW